MNYLYLLLLSALIWAAMWACERWETRQDEQAESTAYWLKRDGRKGFES